MRTITIDSRKINLRRAGSGSPVLCLHCSSSHSGQYKPLIASLEDRFDFLAPDLHGYGQSDALPRDGQAWYVHDLKIVKSLLDSVNLPVQLVGHSLGGALGFMAALKWPEKIKSVTLIEPVLFMLLAQSGNPLIAEGYFATSMVHSNIHLGRPDHAARAFMDFWSDTGAYDHAPEHVRDYVTDTINRVADDWAGMVPGIPGAPDLNKVCQMELPTLLIKGAATRASAAAIVDLLNDRLPNAEVIEIPSAAHMAAASQPHLVNPHIQAFLDRNT